MCVMQCNGSNNIIIWVEYKMIEKKSSFRENENNAELFCSFFFVNSRMPSSLSSCQRVPRILNVCIMYAFLFPSAPLLLAHLLLYQSRIWTHAFDIVLLKIIKYHRARGDQHRQRRHIFHIDIFTLLSL